MSQEYERREELEAYAKMVQAIARCDRRIIWIGPPPAKPRRAPVSHDLGELNAEAPLGPPD